MLDQSHRIFGGKGPIGQGESQGVARSVLEIGSGPTPFNTASPSAWATSIVWTDFLQENRDYLWSWLQTGTPSFISFFEHVAEMEGKTAESISARLRSRVCGVMSVDVTLPSPLYPMYLQVDLVYAHLCLEYISADRASFQQLLYNISSLVSPGGHLVLQSTTGADSFYVDGVRFPATDTDKEFLESCLEVAGLWLVEYEEFSSPGEARRTSKEEKEARRRTSREERREGKETKGEKYGPLFKYSTSGPYTWDFNHSHNGVYSLVAKKPFC